MKNPWNRKVSWVLPYQKKRRNTTLQIKFYDTCALLNLGEKVFNGELFAVSSITFKELEGIKTSFNKDNDVKAMARHLLHLFDKYEYNYIPIVHKETSENRIALKGFEINNDTKILSDALYLADDDEEVTFITADLSLRCIARCFEDIITVESVLDEEDTYTGYLEVDCSDEQLAFFYEHQNKNIFNLLEGQYLVLYHNNEMVDLRVWRNGQPQFLNYKDFNSTWFGKVVPFKGDTYQKMLFDSLSNNQLTLVRGPAGSGKTITCLAYLMSQLEKHRIDKIIVFCNTVATMGSAKLGFYPGTRDEKLLDSQIGNLLSSKLGGREGVERLISEGKLELLPLSDIRGYDTNGMKAGIYISEAQNLDRALMKLAVQRVGEDCICLIDGDSKTQVDDLRYAGINSGMRRLSQVFRGADFYGEVELKNIYRSRIAEIAEQF